MKRMTLALAAILASSGLAMAQSGGTVGGAVGGAATGAVIGGPVGAAVGGVAGAVIGSAIDPAPAEVQTYVVEQPANSVTITGPVAVGEPLPETVVLQPVPQSEYRYAVVNERRVIVEPGTRRVIQVIE